MKNIFDIQELKRLRQEEEKQTKIVTIQISKTPLQINPKVKVSVNNMVDWRTFANLMEAFHKRYTAHKVLGINRLMEQEERKEDAA